MAGDPFVNHLIVDANAFLKNVKLERIGKNIHTLEDVVAEIKDQATKERLQVLPYQINFTSIHPNSASFVTEFSKKTGDYPSLSAVDLKLLALTHTLESIHCGGTEHLRKEPNSSVSTLFSNFRPQAINPKTLAGFHISKGVSSTNASTVNSRTTSESAQPDPNAETNRDNLEKEGKIESDKKDMEYLDSSEKTPNSSNENLGDRSITELRKDMETLGLSCENVESKREVGSEEEEEGSSDYDSSDEDDWITPENIEENLIKMGSPLHPPSQSTNEHLQVACLTTDFAMQNVLLHMGLKVVSVDGMVVKKLKTFILRCHACFKTTSVMTKKFCPACGNETLDKVGISVNPEDGSTQLHLSNRKKINRRGLKYSLPAPKGGKHSWNPILFEDQRIPHNRMSKKQLDRINPLDPEYVARDSPFSVNDVTSRSSLLGLQSFGRAKGNSNPNSGKRGKRRGGKRR